MPGWPGCGCDFQGPSQHLVMCGHGSSLRPSLPPALGSRRKGTRGVRTHPTAPRLPQLAAWLGGCQARPARQSLFLSLRAGTHCAGTHCAAAKQAAFREARPTERVSPAKLSLLFLLPGKPPGSPACLKDLIVFRVGHVALSTDPEARTASW